MSSLYNQVLESRLLGAQVGFRIEAGLSVEEEIPSSWCLS